MSWPSDGEPRFKVASIRGGIVGATPNSRGWDAVPTVAYYVLDRANCHRVVRHVLTTTPDGAAQAGRAAIERMAARLNGEPLPL